MDNPRRSIFVGASVSNSEVHSNLSPHGMDLSLRSRGGKTGAVADRRGDSGMDETSQLPGHAATTPHKASESRLIAVAQLLRPQGRRGELLAAPLTDLPGVLVAGRAVVLGTATTAFQTGMCHPLRLDEVWFPTGKNAGRVVLKISGCDSISQAEVLAGAELRVPVTDLPALEPDTFFAADLVGCELYDGHTLAGRIVDVQFPVSSTGQRLEDAASLLAVQPIALGTVVTTLANGNVSTRGDDSKHDEGSDQDRDPKRTALPEREPVLVPFVRAWLESVDLPGRRVTMHLPAGLLDDL